MIYESSSTEFVILIVNAVFKINPFSQEKNMEAVKFVKWYNVQYLAIGI